MTVTQGAQWRKEVEEGVELYLPSGNTARIRGVNLDAFLRSKTIPDLLSPLVSELINGKTDPKELTVEQYLEYVDIYDAFCKACFVSPKVVDDPQADDEISPQDIANEDKMFLFEFLGRPAILLSSFRPKQNGTVESMVSESGDPASAVPAAGHRGLGESDHADG